MPRRLADCRSCQRRFIAMALNIHECEVCCCKVAMDGTSWSQEIPATTMDPLVLCPVPGSAPTITTAENLSPVGTPRKRSVCDIQEVTETSMKHSKKESITDCNDDDGNDDDVVDDEEGSEAGDDMHCTQICNSDELDSSSSDDEDDVDNKPLIQLVNNRRGVKEGGSAGDTKVDNSTVDLVGTSCGIDDVIVTVDDDDGANFELAQGQGFDANHMQLYHDTCLVCGASLVHLSTLKSRLNHMKRCSKKNGVSAKDVRWDDDHEMFVLLKDESNAHVVSTSKSEKSPSKVIINPYAKNSSPSSTVSPLKVNDPLDTDTGGRISGGKSSLPSLNNVLMAGARRAAKLKQIQTKAAATTTAAAAQKNGRQPRAWPRKPRGTCPSYKKIPGTDFCVDGFQFIAETRNFFLTHFHSDHYGGISSSWESGTIYCSLATANLVNQQLGVDRKFLHPLPMLSPVVIETQGRAATVTLIDANHCPGAVMFLFQVGNRNILHVGDFRWNRTFMQEQAPLRPFFSGKSTLDILFLDTTYCDAKYTLPTQDAAIQAAIAMATREVEGACRSKKSLLLLFGAYTIGKERIYLAVAEHLNIKVYVNARRYRILKQLGWPSSRMDLLTTKPSETTIWVVPLGHINMKKLPEYLNINIGSFRKNFDRVVGFRPTGWSHSSKGNGIIQTNARGHITVHGVPYSEHSSFPELLDCLRCLKPKRIIPTVSVSKSQQQVDLLLSKL